VCARAGPPKARAGCWRRARRRARTSRKCCSLVISITTPDLLAKAQASHSIEYSSGTGSSARRLRSWSRYGPASVGRYCRARCSRPGRSARAYRLTVLSERSRQRAHSRRLVPLLSTSWICCQRSGFSLVRLPSRSGAAPGPAGAVRRDFLLHGLGQAVLQVSAVADLDHGGQRAADRL